MSLTTASLTIDPTLLAEIPSTAWADFETAIHKLEDTDESYKATMLALQSLSELSQNEGLSPPTSLLLEIARLAEKTLDKEISTADELLSNGRGALVDLSCNETYDPNTDFWKTMQSWVEGSREDLQSSALLILGNSARNGEPKAVMI